jgi:hypothetical protein
MNGNRRGKKKNVVKNESPKNINKRKSKSKKIINQNQVLQLEKEKNMRLNNSSTNLKCSIRSKNKEIVSKKNKKDTNNSFINNSYVINNKEIKSYKSSKVSKRMEKYIPICQELSKKGKKEINNAVKKNNSMIISKRDIVDNKI